MERFLKRVHGKSIWPSLKRSPGKKNIKATHIQNLSHVTGFLSTPPQGVAQRPLPGVTALLWHWLHLQQQQQQWLLCDASEINWNDWNTVKGWDAARRLMCTCWTQSRWFEQFWFADLCHASLRTAQLLSLITSYRPFASKHSHNTQTTG